MELGGVALELALKSFFAKRGILSRIKCDHSLRHNLIQLWNEATGLGLQMPQQPSWLPPLNGLHDHPFTIRYPEAMHGFIMPEPKSLAAEVEALILHVRAQIL